MKEYLRAFEESKHSKQREFDDMVDGGAYFGVDMSKDSFLAGVERGSRGSMDQFLTNELEDGKVVPPSATAKEHRSRVCLDIGRFFFENAIPFNCIRSSSFVSMMRSIGGYGRGLKPPSMHEMRTWILKDEIKATWKHTGVSLLSDGWSDMRNRSLINFLVNNQYGTVYLKTVDESDVVKNAQKLFELLDEVVEEIEEGHVVQVITDNAVAYKAVGRLLMEKRTSLYWTSYAAHCIDLIIEKIGELPQHKNALLKAKRVTNYIHNHQWILSLTRKFAKKDLLRPAATRFATTYLTLESMYELKQPLQQIVAYSIKTTKPLVDVLRVVDGERAPAMGYIYATMDEAKEKIAKNLNDKLIGGNILEMKFPISKHLQREFLGLLARPRLANHRHSKRQLRKEKDDPLVVEDIASGDEWIANPNDEDDIDVDDANSDDIESDHMDEGTRKEKEVEHRLVDEDLDEDGSGGDDDN
ncbi:uncharacterized protein LOC131008377 [Salvia miltiorrhiza]|uniref:uncharacterized protein LOC131008377 n=1 Tax=Salvia miltiorrhiza TaxID=226208 RepID=UPI0025AC219C|nr:uncharacterized protein LOC131008377 [Salvia miltiorrhiza]